MSECKTCGREDGHWLGCPEVTRDRALVVTDDEKCAFGDCREPKRPKGKGPAPKYCEEHSDPKNRKQS